MFAKSIMKNAYLPKISILLHLGSGILGLLCSNDSIQILLILSGFVCWGSLEHNNNLRLISRISQHVLQWINFIALKIAASNVDFTFYSATALACTAVVCLVVILSIAICIKLYNILYNFSCIAVKGLVVQKIAQYNQPLFVLKQPIHN